MMVWGSVGRVVGYFGSGGIVAGMYVLLPLYVDPELTLSSFPWCFL